MASTERARLVLVTPRGLDADALAAALRAALGGGDVAAVVVDLTGRNDGEAAEIARAVVPVIQESGAAAMLTGERSVVDRTGADGLHLDLAAFAAGVAPAASGGGGGGEDEDDEDDDDGRAVIAALRDLVARMRATRQVGAGGLGGRHDAMIAGEADVDYVFFGLLDRPEGEAPTGKTIDLAEWWAPLFEIPCIALAGRSIDGVGTLAEAGAEFVALRAGCFEHPDGPAAAVAAANRILDSVAA